MGRDLGDFQTPPALAAAVLARVGRGRAGEARPRVLEPTCGRGNFVAGLLALDPPPAEIFGVEVQPGHLVAAAGVAARAGGATRVVLVGSNLFELDLAALDWSDRSRPLLVVGNPPWVTNAEFGVLESGNRPPRSNARGARGIDAMTGASNFDAAEAVWIKLLTELAGQAPTIALLCKTAVARNVLEHARRHSLPVTRAEVVRIDARAWFGAAVDACLLVLGVGAPEDPHAGPPDRVAVYAGLDAAEPESSMGFARGRLVADLDAYAPFARFDGVCPFTWRQGVKHDAAAVMELSPSAGGGWKDRAGNPVEVEPETVYPQLKGTDLSRPAPVAPRRSVILTQRSVGDDTRRLETEAPRLWAYLQGRAEAFLKRKSSVYRGRPPFAMFGVGPYSFSACKVGVSGLHRAPVFHAIGPHAGRPVMLDDTGYFLPCTSPEQAALVAALLNGPGALGLLKSLALPGSKRPVTKALLQRLDFPALAGAADRPALLARAGRDVQRLADRPPRWPTPPESLLEPDPVPATLRTRETQGPWPSPPSATSAVR